MRSVKIIHGNTVKSRFVGMIFRMLHISICAAMLFCAFSVQGATVQKGQKGLRHDLFSVSFPTEKDGWACGRWGTILHTVDGGQSWIGQKSGTDYTLTSISFVDPKNGWAVGDVGTILHTKDGGATWEKQKSPVNFFLMGVHFADSRKGWAVGERTNILNTTDGGQTWKVQFKDQDFVLKSVSFCNDRNGWAAGEYGLIYGTENGGATWTKQAGGFGFSEETGDLVTGNVLFNVNAVDPKTAWAVGIDGYVTKTTDGGKTWQVIEKGIPKIHLFRIAQGGANLVIGGSALLLESTDGGSTFKTAKAEPGITYGWIYGIASRDNKGFVAVGKGGWIYVSDPKGTAWQKVTY
jgi:photosystem II stability/assembly factor-like uncharacterized protein